MHRVLVGYLLGMQTNLITVIAIVFLTSTTTGVVFHWLLHPTARPIAGSVDRPTPRPLALQAGPSAIPDCSEGVYSPVQRACVDQQTFDAEMQRLFTALGLDARAYAPEMPFGPSSK